MSDIPAEVTAIFSMMAELPPSVFTVDELDGELSFGARVELGERHPTDWSVFEEMVANPLFPGAIAVGCRATGRAFHVDRPDDDIRIISDSLVHGADVYSKITVMGASHLDVPTGITAMDDQEIEQSEMPQLLIMFLMGSTYEAMSV